jgi:phospholipid/cholesterol/gamma-HCH transport system ATP-binding protein
MIEIKHISKQFDDRVILEDISAQFKPGMCNLIIGASGSGKTVLTKCIVDLIQADNGHIFFDSVDAASMSKEDKKELRNNIGMLFQGNALFDSLTVEENVRFPLDMFTTLSDTEKVEKVNKILARVNLTGFNDKFPAEISGGMKKRVGLARAIVLNPKYLFCDEPNSGLDPNTAILIDNLIKEITEEYNITTVINTHDMNSVMEIGEKIIFLKNGLKAWEGNKEEIFRTDNQAIVDFVYSSNLFKKVREAYLMGK